MMVMTENEIEVEAKKLKTYIKRRNMRRRLKVASNNTVDALIKEKRQEIRLMLGATERDKRKIYAELSRL